MKTYNKWHDFILGLWTNKWDIENLLLSSYHLYFYIFISINQNLLVKIDYSFYTEFKLSINANARLLEIEFILITK